MTGGEVADKYASFLVPRLRYPRGVLCTISQSSQSLELWLPTLVTSLIIRLLLASVPCQCFLGSNKWHALESLPWGLLLGGGVGEVSTKENLSYPYFLCLRRRNSLSWSTDHFQLVVYFNYRDRLILKRILPWGDQRCSSDRMYYCFSRESIINWIILLYKYNGIWMHTHCAEVLPPLEYGNESTWINSGHRGQI